MDSNLMQRIESMETRIAELEKLYAVKPSAILPVKAQSVREFLLNSKPTSAAQLTLLIAYFAEHINGMQFWNVDDLETLFRSAKEKPPANINDIVNKNILKGHIMEHTEKKDNKKSWLLTASGENFVESEIRGGKI